MNINNDRIFHKAAQMILDSRHAVVFTGAGVSTESGIPDFRSPGGIWDRFDQKAFDYSSFIQQEESRIMHWELFRSLITGVFPNPAHFAIGELCKQGYVKAVITQNIDGLHQLGGAPTDLVHELHGSMNTFTCLGCRHRFTLDIVLDMAQKSPVPVCPECNGIIKPDVVFFGESLPAKALEQAQKESSLCDLFFVIGSTLTVYPAALMPEYALSNGAKLVIINLSPTPLDEKADLAIYTKAGKVLPSIVEYISANPA
ncbi:MAG: NAD-dependent deacylase [Dehalococcoidales bacterium]|jgi:NAD-dependent deacetylase|nr:NAD-dependent deacylase [Dehalococcoidales bacterium]MDX9986285.1 NAD-dependent deacylase [Dehalococcoidales bacterium]